MVHDHLISEMFLIVGPIMKPCSCEPCLNRGFCIEVGGSNYKCECSAGYSGENCQNGEMGYVRYFPDVTICKLHLLLSNNVWN